MCGRETVYCEGDIENTIRELPDTRRKLLVCERRLNADGVQNDTPCRFIKNYEFDYPQTNSHFIVTAVVGHLTALEFPGQYRQWQSCDPGELFDAETMVYIPDDKKPVERNLQTQARRVDTVMIWTDCDREGEHIGMEVVNVCRKVKPNITVKRARFSAIIAQCVVDSIYNLSLKSCRQIHRAAQHPVELDRRQADSVDARIILDLKVGAAFTRLQTLTLQNRITLPEKSVLSYGPCQFPTLGFVVERFLKVKDFRQEQFWYIHMDIVRGDNEVAEFRWKRGHIFDNHMAASLYSMVVENHTARVLSVTKKETKKW